MDKQALYRFVCSKELEMVRKPTEFSQAWRPETIYSSAWLNNAVREATTSGFDDPDPVALTWEYGEHISVYTDMYVYGEEIVGGSYGIMPMENVPDEMAFVLETTEGRYYLVNRDGFSYARYLAYLGRVPK